MDTWVSVFRMVNVSLGVELPIADATVDPTTRPQ